MPDLDPAPAHGSTSKRPRVTGLVTCFNEEHNIAECIESLLWCDEIIVVDSFSSDRTPEIVRSFEQVRFFQRTYFGAGAQKNWALQHVTGDWVFLLDADERCTPELRDEALALLDKGPGAEAYMVNRLVYFLGKPIRYSGWQRDRVVRFFRVGRAYYENRRVHSILHVQGETHFLQNRMPHLMVDRSFDEYAFRIAKYALWGAAQAWRDGERSNFAEVSLRALWRFLRTYVVQLGFLDGVRGMVFCLLQAYGTYLKWAILWGWQVNQARGIEPQLPEFDDSVSTWEGLQRVSSTSGESTQGA